MFQGSSTVTVLQKDDIYEQTFRRNPTKMLLIDVESGVIADANTASVEFYGYPAGQLVGMKISEINILPEGEIRDLIGHAVSMGSAQFRFKHRLASGIIRDVEIHTSLVTIANGKFLYSMVRDISEQVLIEERLRYGEQLFIQLVTKTPLALAMFDTEMKYLFVSERWISSFDFEPADRIGKNYYETFPDQPGHWKTAHSKAMAGEHVRFDQDLFVRPDGRQEWIRWEALNWLKENDELGGIIIYKEIITNKKKAEEARNRFIEQRSRMAAKYEAIEEERRKIARDLHDGLGQMLSAAHFNLNLIERNISDDRQRAMQSLHQTNKIITETIREVRGISQRLRPTVLDDLGLVAALRNLCDQFNSSDEIEIEFRAYDLNGPYRPGIEIAVFRICQEALSNILRHAAASEALVEIYDRKSHLLMVIQDDGDGFDPDEIFNSSSGSGLLNIRERVEMLDGSFQIETSPGNGTELIIEIPMEKNPGGVEGSSKKRTGKGKPLKFYDNEQ